MTSTLRISTLALLLLASAALLMPLRWPADWPPLPSSSPIWLASGILAALGLLAARAGLWRGMIGAALVCLQMPILTANLPAMATVMELSLWQIALLPGFCNICLGAALIAYQPDSERPDAALWLGGLAAISACLLVIARLFGAAPWLQGANAQSIAVIDILVIAAPAALFLLQHPASPAQGLIGDDPAAQNRRRMLPAALVVPLAVGALLLLTLKLTALDVAAAIALSVVANLVMMLFLVAHSGRHVRQLDQDRQEKQAARERRVRLQGQKDGLTRLLNRKGWDEELKQAEQRCKKQKLDACIVIIDLDGLKRLNDTQGHHAGDELIQQAAAALRKAARRKDTLARLGGDEFAYLAVDCDDRGAEALIARMRGALAEAEVSASLGYGLRGKRSIKAAVQDADAAMYEDKRARKERGDAIPRP